MSCSALGGSGMEVRDVSVGAISSSEVLFESIVLQLAGGGTLGLYSLHIL